MAWEPEDGRCRVCNGPLETEYEQDAGSCSWCQDREEGPEEDKDDPINEH